MINQELAIKLTKHEFKVVLLMVEGETTASISQKLEIKANTILHLKNDFFKIRCKYKYSFISGYK